MDLADAVEPVYKSISKYQCDFVIFYNRMEHKIIFSKIPQELQYVLHHQYQLEDKINTTPDQGIFLTTGSIKGLRQLKIPESNVNQLLSHLLNLKSKKLVFYPYSKLKSQAFSKSQVTSERNHASDILEPGTKRCRLSNKSDIEDLHRFSNYCQQRVGNGRCVKVVETENESQEHTVNITVQQPSKNIIKEYTRSPKKGKKNKRELKMLRTVLRPFKNAYRFKRHFVTWTIHKFQNVLDQISKDAFKMKYLFKKLKEILDVPMMIRQDLFVYSGRRKHKYSGGGRRNQPTKSDDRSQQNQHPMPPIQVCADPIPSDYKIVTSSTTIFGRNINQSHIPVTNQQTHQASLLLALRLRGNLPASRFSTPREPPRHPQYLDLTARQQSFSNWPATSGQDPERMASNGFFYTGRFDLIRCFQCGIGLKDWAAPDEPLFEHIKHSPECVFLKELLGEELLGAYRMNLISAPLGQQGNVTVPPPSSGSASITTTVRNPQYTEQETRVRSFANWPSSTRQPPARMAEAGLFYTGTADLCRCFTCDGGLQNWDLDDDPWLEHARWFPNCAYVRQIKGEEYINLVQDAVRHARMEEEESAVVYPHGRSNLQDEDPLKSAAARAVLDMGYSRSAVKWAIMEVRSKAGDQNLAYTSDNLLHVLTERQDRGEALPMDEGSPVLGATAGVFSSDPVEENRQLKKILKCMKCNKNDTNILFLPCTHHRLCEPCARDETHCLVCHRPIDQKIKTFMS